MRNTGILYASSLVGLATANSFRQKTTGATLTDHNVSLERIQPVQSASVIPVSFNVDTSSSVLANLPLVSLPALPIPTLHQRLHQLHLQKRGNIHHAVDYYRKADLKDPDSQKWNDNLLKAQGARYNDPKYSERVINNYNAKKTEAGQLILNGQGRNGEVMKKILSWDEKVFDWQQRKNDLKKLEKEAAGSHSIYDDEVEKQVKNYQKNWRAQPSELPHPKYDLQKRGVIPSPVHYYQKADVKPIDSTKWHANSIKAEGARWNDPAYSQVVVDHYKAKVDAIDKVYKRRKATTPMAKKMISYEAKLTDWKERVERLEKEKKEKSSDSITDAGVEKQVKEYHDNWKSEPFSFPDPKYDLPKEPVIHSAVQYLQKAYSYNPSSQKWDEHFKKASGARFNDPEASQDVVDMYKKKINEAKSKLESIQDPFQKLALKDKVARWEKLIPLWEKRREERAIEKGLKVKAGSSYNYKDDQIEKEIEQYHNPPKGKSSSSRLYKRSMVDEPTLQKRSEPVIHKAPFYAKKADNYFEMRKAVGPNKLFSKKHRQNREKEYALRYNHPSHTKKVIDRYEGKIKTVQELIEKSKGYLALADLTKSLSEKSSTYNKKLLLWKNRHDMLEVKRASTSPSKIQEHDPVAEAQITDYYAYEHVPNLERLEKKIKFRKWKEGEKSGAIQDPVYHYKKADMKPIDSAKWKHSLLKADGARYNDPRYSQKVVDSYKIMLDNGLVQAQGSGTLPGKTLSLFEKKENWENRRDELKIDMWKKKEDKTYSITDKDTEENVKHYQKNWRSRPVSLPHHRYDLPKSAIYQGNTQQVGYGHQHDEMPHSVNAENKETKEITIKTYIPTLQKRTIPSTDHPLQRRDLTTVFEPQFHKRTKIEAVEFMKEMDEIEKRPANTDVEEAEKIRKWMENLKKSQGARYNSPGDSAAVVGMYNDKIRDARILRANGEGDPQAISRKIRLWKEDKIPLWGARRQRLADDMLDVDKYSTGGVSERDAQVEAKIQQFEVEKEEREKKPVERKVNRKRKANSLGQLQSQSRRRLGIRIQPQPEPLVETIVQSLGRQPIRLYQSKRRTLNKKRII